MKSLKDLPKSAQEKILACQLEWHPDPIIEAKKYQSALSEESVSQELLAKATGRKRTYIANVVRILALPLEVQRLVSQQKLSVSQARLILSAMPEMQIRLAKDCVFNHWTTRELKTAIKSARPSESEVKKAAQKLHEETGLISQVQTNDKGNYFIRFAFRSATDAQNFLKKIKKL